MIQPIPSCLTALCLTFLVCPALPGQEETQQKVQKEASTSDQRGDSKSGDAAKQTESDAVQRRPLEWTERFDQRYLEQAPLLNDYAPSVSAFDENGKRFRMRDTEGKYTVIVFGCLT